MQKMRGFLITGVLVLLLCGIVGAGEMDPVGSANLSVIVSPPANGGDTFYVGETVSFSGVNHISDKTYVRIVNYVLNDNDPRLVLNVVNGQWSGSYTHTNSARSGRSQLVIKPYSDEVAGTLPVYPEQAFAYFNGYPGPRPTPTPNPTPTINDDLFTLKINGVNYQNLNNPSFTWGDTIRFSGTKDSTPVHTVDGSINAASVYIVLEDPLSEVGYWKMPEACTGLTFGSTIRPIKVQSDNTWSYDWNTGDPACKYPNVDAHLRITTLNKDPVPIPIIMKAVPVPTTAITTGQTTAVTTGPTSLPTTVPTSGQTTSITTAPTPRTPRPTATVNHSATIEKIEKQIAEQNAKIEEQGNWIDQILRFLGLK